MRSPTEIAASLTRELGSGERLLWSGQPRQGTVFRASEWFMTPFALLWGGFAFFWEWQVIQSDAPTFFALWGVPFVLVGIYLILGRFMVEARQRERTYYGVTNERVLIVSGLFGRKVKSLSLRNLSDFSLSESASGEGSISFGGGVPFGSWFGGFAGWPGMEGYMGPRFELIPNAKSVYTTLFEMHSAQPSKNTSNRAIDSDAGKHCALSGAPHRGLLGRKKWNEKDKKPP